MARARHAVKAVTAGDEVAIHPCGFTVLAERDVRSLGFDVHQPHVRDLGQHGGTAAVGRCEQILLDLRLPVRHEALADVSGHVDEEAVAACPDDSHAVVRVAFAVHALCEAMRAQQIHRGLLENAGADARQHMLAAALSSTTLSIAWLCSISDSNRPAGPPPTIRTCVLIDRRTLPIIAGPTRHLRGAA